MKFRNFRSGLVLFGAALAVVQPVAGIAATFNFNGIADGASFFSTEAPDILRSGFEGNWNRPDGLNPGITAVVGNGAGILDKTSGIAVFATGTSSTGAAADAFFDSNNAGLGVCSSLSCKSGVPGAVTGDDNLNRDEESLIFTFNQRVQVAGLTILDARHNLPTGDFSIGGTLFSIVNGVVDPAGLARIAPSDSFTLKYVTNGPELYVGDFSVAPAPVPLPAGFVLLASALAGLGAVSRHRRRT